MKYIVTLSALLMSLLVSVTANATPLEALPSSSYSQSGVYNGYTAESAFNGGNWNSSNWGTQWLQVDMGSIQTIDWVSFITDQSPNDVTWHSIYISDNAIGSNWSSLTAVASRSGFTVAGTLLQLDFAPTSGRFLEIVANNGASWTALSNVKVNSVTVVEPSAFALASFGLIGLLALRRRK